MKDKIKAEIERLGEYTLVHPGKEPKENLRAAYEVALILDGLPHDFAEKPADMLQRAGNFIFGYLSVVLNIQAGLMEDAGISGGATGFNLGYIKHIEPGEAEKLMKATIACHAAELLKIDLENITSPKSEKEKS